MPPATAGPAVRDTAPAPGASAVPSPPEPDGAYSGGNGGASDPGAQTTQRPSPSLNHETRPDDADRRQRTPR